MCAYCSGTGKVHRGIESNVPVDASYLVVNLEEAERKRILEGHPDAIDGGNNMKMRSTILSIRLHICTSKVA
jgi:hypothetical protein